MEKNVIKNRMISDFNEYQSSSREVDQIKAMNLHKEVLYILANKASAQSGDIDVAINKLKNLLSTEFVKNAPPGKF